MHLKGTIIWNLMFPFSLDFAPFLTLKMDAETSQKVLYDVTTVRTSELSRKVFVCCYTLPRESVIISISIILQIQICDGFCKVVQPVSDDS
jgi:hypothetical protein